MPTGSVIDSIKVGVQRSGSAFQDHQVYLVKAGVVQTAKNAASTTNWTSSSVTEWHGGAPSYWTGTWGVTDVNHAGFGVAFAADKDPGGAATAQVDHLPIEVCYSAATGPHHLQIEHASGSGSTCSATTFTVRACADAACSTGYTGGVTGSLSASNASFSWPGSANFSIASGASTTTVSGLLPVAGTASLSVASSSPTATAAATCLFGGSTSCTYTSATAGFTVTVADHRAEDSGMATISASCAGLADVTRTLTLGCSYVDPGSGTLPLRMGAGLTPLNASASATAACGSRDLSVYFDASGTASLDLRYADVGRMSLTATYSGSAGTGDAGVTITGSTQFVVAPASFALTLDGSPPRTAGQSFTGQLQARNGLGAVTPNFGLETTPETAVLSFTRLSPAGGFDGLFAGDVGAFAGGQASLSNLIWSEVGEGRVSAQLGDGSYLGSAFNVTGQVDTGAFRPHRLLIGVTPGCDSFTYADQPFERVTVTALNATGGTTQNYDGSLGLSRVLTFADAKASTKGGLDTGNTSPLSAQQWPASQFVQGVAESSLRYRFTAKQTAPMRSTDVGNPALQLRATDADGVSSSVVTADEPLLDIWSGRLTLESRSGSAASSLSLPVRIEAWSGKAWALHAADSCTAARLSTTAIAVSSPTTLRGATASWGVTAASLGGFSGGLGSLRLNAPVPAGGSGSVDVALNLGSTTTDRACVAQHPTTTGAGLAWLRSRFGVAQGCNDRWDSDPSARASFGAAIPESQRRVHERQVY
ncbi:DUF6701 domain-containing protein [Inhella gelatinilytica]|uniref:DUF6701 domain-containing protein n=1 Tax=Inhella gelatinilytica TaxID=2795030 RepID=A0A931N9G0_9BURK|nr:DUF6701 domain-containing protein [Inhella gelatinilytica]MBH9551328.1 hypothetical protein [Inhella gelatinilytica]